MKNKLYLIMLLGILLIGNVFALEGIGTYKSGEQVRIVQVCSDATWISLSSISYPNSTVSLTPTNLSSAGSGEFYLWYNNTIPTGRYQIRGISDGCEGTFATYFDITPTGDERKFGFFLILLLSAIVFFIGGYLLDQDWLVFLSAILWIITGMYSMIYGISNMTNLYTRAIAGVVIAIGLVLIVASIFNMSKGGSNSDFEE